MRQRAAEGSLPVKLGQHLPELPSLELLLAHLFLSPACDIKEGLVTEARLLLATQEQMPPIRMPGARLAERSPPLGYHRTDHHGSVTWGQSRGARGRVPSGQKGACSGGGRAAKQGIGTQSGRNVEVRQPCVS